MAKNKYLMIFFLFYRLNFPYELGTFPYEEESKILQYQPFKKYEILQKSTFKGHESILDEIHTNIQARHRNCFILSNYISDDFFKNFLFLPET